MRRVAFALILGVVGLTAEQLIASAQTLSFEVATIKPSIPGPVVRIGGSCHGTDSKYYPSEIVLPENLISS